MTGRIRNSIRAAVGLVVVGALVVPSTTSAQAARGGKGAAPKVETEIEEITVVAQKREENIQEVPVSVTALTSEALDARNVTDVAAIGQMAPNVRIQTNSGSDSGTSIAIRGVGQANPNMSFQTAAGMYVDGAYISKIQGSNLDLEDLERVEVLRGPQGTLFGRNTIAGAINFITKKPTEERAITARTEVGNFDYFKGRITANVPIVGKNGFFQSEALGTLSLRQNVMYKSHDGYSTNRSPTSVPATGSKWLDDLSRVFTMTAVRWQPIAPLTVDYSGEYHRYRQGVSKVQATYIYPGSPVSPGKPFDLTPYVRTNRVDAIGNNVVCNLADITKCSRRMDDGNHRMHILTATYDVGEVGMLGNVTVRSVSSYRHFFHQQAQDSDGSPLHIADFGSVNTVKQWSEELQLVGTAPRVHYVLGGYYYGEHADQDQFQVFMAGATNLPSTINVSTDSYAPFGQVTVTPPILNDKLSVTAGIRYSQEQVHMDRYSRCVTITSLIGGRPVNVCNNPLLPASAFPQLQTWRSERGKAFGGIHGSGAPGISPMANITYQATDELMIYGRIARGFKSGGFNGATTDPRAFAIPFEPEKLLQYELGFKSQWFDNRLRFNAAGYYSDYKDLQQGVFRASPQAGVLSFVSNVDSAEIWGSELELTAVPFRGLEVTATYGLTLPKFLEWNDQKFDASNQPVFENGPQCPAPAPPCVPVTENVASKRAFAFTPDHQAALSLSYTAPPTTTGTLSSQLDVFWQDKQTFIPNDQTRGAQAMKAPNYAVVDGRIQFAGIPLQKGSLDVAVFSRNLFDRKYRISGVDFGQALGWAQNSYGFPRTFGLQLTYNFAEG
ncbi:MAG: TonB-dependent receptor [Candidatus Binatia bacterium]